MTDVANKHPLPLPGAVDTNKFICTCMQKTKLLLCQLTKH